MVLIGSDFHPSWQQVSWFNQATGETGDHKLVHEPGAVKKFYSQFPAGSLIGMEATGNCQWFVELLTSLGNEVWIGDAAKIRASDTRQQKHDKRDARLLVRLRGGKSLSADLDSVAGTEGFASAADSSPQVGANSHTSKKRTATSGDEPGNAEEKTPVE